MLSSSLLDDILASRDELDTGEGILRSMLRATGTTESSSDTAWTTGSQIGTTCASSSASSELESEDGLYKRRCLNGRSHGITLRRFLVISCKRTGRCFSFDELVSELDEDSSSLLVEVGGGGGGGGAGGIGALIL